MFGVLRPCPHRLSEALHADWVAHLCGLCLTLRDEHGQFARTVTNYDGLVISALVEAQSDRAENTQSRRKAGPCPLRGMRRASVAEGDGSRLAAAVSLVLASAKLRDHSDDGDGAFRHRTVSGVGRLAATRWSDQAQESGSSVGFDTALLTDAVNRQTVVESSLSTADSVLDATEPTECATAAAFAHTAVLAEHPENSEELSEVGRLFGRVAHLLDAVEDRAEDTERGAWNPLLATETSLAEAHRLCRDAVHGIRLALDDITLTAPDLARALLVHELNHAVRRTFGHAGHLHENGGDHESGNHEGGQRPNERQRHHNAGGANSAGPHGDPNAPTDPELPTASGTDDGKPPTKSGSRKQPKDGDGGGCCQPKFRVPPRKRNTVFGCLIFSYMCCSCQFCCRDPFPGPWSGEPHDNGCGDACDCDCCSGCDCDCGC